MRVTHLKLVYLPSSPCYLVYFSLQLSKFKNISSKIFMEPCKIEGNGENKRVHTRKQHVGDGEEEMYLQ